MSEAADPPPPWIVKLRTIVYSAAKYWWAAAPVAMLLARLWGLEWTAAVIVGALVLLAVLAGPFAFGVLVALVSHSPMRGSADDH